MNSSFFSGLGSKRTCFLHLLGVVGGGDMRLDFDAGKLVPAIAALFLLADTGWSLTLVAKRFSRPVMI